MRTTKMRTINSTPVCKVLFLAACFVFTLVHAGAQTVTTPGGSTNNVPKFSSSSTIVNSAISENNGNLQVPTNKYFGGFTDPNNLADGGYLNFTGMCCSIDGTHSGYGAWLNYNGFFNGNNWIQPRGDLNTYMFTSNYHAPGWGWFTSAPTGGNGSVFTPKKIASLDGSGNMTFWDPNSYIGGFTNASTLGDGGFLNFTGACCSIDGTHSGYGVWLNYNGYFSGNNWIQPRGDLATYLFTSNYHAGGWGWFSAPASNPNGGSFTITPTEVASMDGSGNLHVNGSLGTSTGVRFPDGSLQTKAQVAGPQGPQGPAGPQGPQGPVGPGSTSAVCVQNNSSGAGCSCAVRLVVQQFAPFGATSTSCTVTSNTGSCSASGGPSSSGACCVCAPN